MKHQWLMRLQVFVIFTLAACDEVVMVENSPPRVTELTVCKQGDRLLWLVGIGDAESDPTDVAIRLNAEQALGISAAESGISTVSPGQFGDGLVGLTSSPTGEVHTIEWAACKPSGATCAVTASVADLAGDENCSCLQEPPEIETMPAFSILLRDHAGTESAVTFDASVPIYAQCPVTVQ